MFDPFAFATDQEMEQYTVTQSVNSYQTQGELTMTNAKKQDAMADQENQEIIGQEMATPKMPTESGTGQDEINAQSDAIKTLDEDDEAFSETSESRKTLTQLVNDMREIFRTSGEEKPFAEDICRKMGITYTKFKDILLELEDRDDKRYKFIKPSSTRNVWVTDTGISVSLKAIENLGMDEVFKIGMKVEFYTTDKKEIKMRAIMPTEEEIRRREEVKKKREEEAKANTDKGASIKVKQEAPKVAEETTTPNN